MKERKRASGAIMKFNMTGQMPVLWRLATGIVAVLHLVIASAVTAKEPFSTTVYKSGNDGYHTYRIPSLLVTRKGTLLAWCEGRKMSRSDHGDIDLVLKSSADRLVQKNVSEVQIAVAVSNPPFLGPALK